MSKVQHMQHQPPASAIAAIRLKAQKNYYTTQSQLSQLNHENLENSSSHNKPVGNNSVTAKHKANDDIISNPPNFAVRSDEVS